MKRFVNSTGKLSTMIFSPEKSVEPFNLHASAKAFVRLGHAATSATSSHTPFVRALGVLESIMSTWHAQTEKKHRTTILVRLKIGTIVPTGPINMLTPPQTQADTFQYGLALCRLQKPRYVTNEIVGVEELCSNAPKNYR